MCADGEKALPSMHVILVYLHGLTSVPVTASHVGRHTLERDFRFVNGLRACHSSQRGESYHFVMKQVTNGQLFT
jgi:hypothetical protein